jgi:hypothetical protein
MFYLDLDIEVECRVSVHRDSGQLKQGVNKTNPIEPSLLSLASTSQVDVNLLQFAPCSSTIFCCLFPASCVYICLVHYTLTAGEMFRRGRKKKDVPLESSTSTARADTEDSEQSRSALHKLRLSLRSPSKGKSTSSVNPGHEPSVSDVHSKAISQDETEALPGALSFQPSDGQTPEILESSTESKVQATSDVDGAASIRVASIRQLRCEESPSAETEPPTLEEQVNTLANLPQFSRPIAGIWDEAYKCLYDKNPKLIKDYQKCLLTQSDGTALCWNENRFIDGKSIY